MGHYVKITTPPDEYLAMAMIGDMHKYFGEIQPCGCRVLRVDRQSNNTLTPPPPGMK